jgi:hypothetical protein
MAIGTVSYFIAATGRGAVMSTDGRARVSLFTASDVAPDCGPLEARCTVEYCEERIAGGGLRAVGVRRI